MKNSTTRQIGLSVLLVGLVVLCCYSCDLIFFLRRGSSLHFHARKLLEAAAGGEKRTEKIGELCSVEDIQVYQGPTAPLPNGIPTYRVEILNACESGCAISNIHMSCGWFSSARLINPKVFKRVSFDDCVVNGGAALSGGRSLSFQYANTFPYSLAVSSVTCNPSSSSEVNADP